MKKSKRRKASWISVLLVTLFFCTLAFATGIAVWRYTPIKTLDILVVEPIGSVPVVTPPPVQVAPIQEIVVSDVEEASVEEPVVNNHPAQVVQEEVTEITEEATAAKPGFIEQSAMGWKIIFAAVKAPFTK